MEEVNWRVSRVPQTWRDYDTDLVGDRRAVLSHPLRREERGGERIEGRRGRKRGKEEMELRIYPSDRLKGDIWRVFVFSSQHHVGDKEAGQADASLDTGHALSQNLSVTWRVNWNP